MNILITGATGFIGRHLVKTLITNGHNCRCLVRNIGTAEKLFENPGNIEFVTGDIIKPESLIGMAKNIDIVFHLAARGHVTATTKNAYKEFFDINVNGTENVIEECLNENVSKFFHFSSTAAVGLIPDKVVDESTPPQPTTPYQKSKFESETLAMDYFKKKEFPAIILRPCMVYGIGGLGEFYKFTKLIKKGLMPIVGKREKLTPIVHVGDVVAACIKSLSAAKAGETYHICGLKSYPFDTILELINKALQKEKPLPIIPESLVFISVSILEAFSKILNRPPVATRQNIKSTIANRIFSIEKAKRELGYQASVNLETGINDTISWYKSENLI